MLYSHGNYKFRQKNLYFTAFYVRMNQITKKQRNSKFSWELEQRNSQFSWELEQKC